MQLSPLNLLGMIGLHRTPNNLPPKPVEEVVMYRCPVCDELHDYESDAKKCCTRTSTGDGDTSNCPVCGEKYNTHRDAADCCLWKDIDAITRWRIADAVENGSDWATQLDVRTH